MKKLILLFLSLIAGADLPAQTTAFTYQGHLMDGGASANGNYDIQFTLKNALSGGSTVGAPIAVAPVNAVNGIFTVSLDFGAAVFDGSDRFVEMGVRPFGSAAAYTILAPRQKITSVPYAMRSISAGTATTATSATNATNLTGTITTGNVSAGFITSAMIANGAVGSSQIAANAVQSSNIASGAVGNTQLASNAVQAANIAAGAVDFSDLAKPYQAGSVDGSAVPMFFGEASFTVTFPQPFTSDPIVSVSLRNTSFTFPPDATVHVTSDVNTTQFTGVIESGTSVPITLDSSGVVGEFNTSLKIVAGNPAIAYHDTSNSSLKYLRSTDGNGVGWDASPVQIDGFVTTAATGRFPSLAVVNGNPAISYYSVSTSALNFVRASDTFGSAWSAPVFADFGNTADMGEHISAAVVSSNPAMCYYDSTNGDLRFVRATDSNGNGWNTPITVTSTDNIGQFTSLAVVSSNPAISYYDVTSGNLKFVRASNGVGTAWGPPITVVSTDDVGQFTSMAVVNGNPAICYYDVTNGDLKYVRATNTLGTTWGSPVSVATGPDDLGRFASLEVVNGNPAISYYDNTGGNLKYVRASDNNGTAWAAPVSLDVTAADVGQFTSLTFLGTSPSIAYYDLTNGNAKFIRATDTNGATWSTPVVVESTGDVGQYSTLISVGGTAGVFFYDNALGTPRFTRSLDSGLSFPLASFTDVTGDVGQFTSMAVASTNPAIAYYDVTGANLRYVRASDASGTAWGVPVTIDSTGDVGKHASLVIANGNPAICYYDTTNGDLKYVRATDALGTAWGAPLVVDGLTTNVGEFCSMALVVGNPAICYRDTTNGDLKYVRATDSSGTAWSTPVICDATGNTGWYGSLAVVSGIPAISYHDLGTGVLKYVSADDSVGSTWNKPVVPDDSESVGRFTSLNVVGGAPAISYMDDAGSALKFVREGNPPLGFRINWIAAQP